MEKIIEQDTIYYGNQWPQMYGLKVRMGAVHKNRLAPNADPDSMENHITSDEDLAKAGGLGEMDSVEIYPWVETEGRFSPVASDADAVDLEYMMIKMGKTPPTPPIVQTVLGATCIYHGDASHWLQGKKVRIKGIIANGLCADGTAPKKRILTNRELAKLGGLGPMDRARVVEVGGSGTVYRVPVTALSLYQPR